MGVHGGDPVGELRVEVVRVGVVTGSEEAVAWVADGAVA